MWLDLITITTVIAWLLYASTRHSVSIIAFYSYYTSLRQIQMYNPSFTIHKPKSSENSSFFISLEQTYLAAKPDLT